MQAKIQAYDILGKCAAMRQNKQLLHKEPYSLYLAKIWFDKRKTFIHAAFDHECICSL